MYLIIFDNADDLAALKTIWPSTIRGSVLVTTRDLVVATTLTTKHTTIDTLSGNEGSEMFLKAVGIENTSSEARMHALEISNAFGGFPLALSQIAGFINQRQMALKEFMPLYHRYSSKIDARRAPGSDYEYTMSTVWDTSFERLTQNSTLLLSLLSFADPDSISEDILIQGSQELNNMFSFMSDDLE